MDSFKDKLLNGEINDGDFWVAFFDLTHKTLYYDLVETIKKLQDELNEEKKKMKKMTHLYEKFMEVTDCKCDPDYEKTDKFCDRCNLYEDFLDLNPQHFENQ